MREFGAESTGVDVLNDLILDSRVNQQWTSSGIDSINGCRDQKLFESYQHKVEYSYNSRGFRDREWPTGDAVWCIGDSFTVGLGSPLEHTWPYLLEQQTGHRCVNLGMDGGSNNWMSRRAIQLIREVHPSTVVIHWSYLHRRELGYLQALEKFWPVFYNRIRDSAWPECEHLREFDQLPDHIKTEISVLHNWPGIIGDDYRTLHYLKTTDDADIENTVRCIDFVNNSAETTKVIHSFIPGFIVNAEVDKFYSQLTCNYIPELVQLDLSRDGHHYDRLTAQSLVDQIILAIK